MKTFFKVLPLELRSEICHYLPEDDLSALYSRIKGTIGEFPEFTALDNDIFWLSIWKRYFSRMNYSDGYVTSQNIKKIISPVFRTIRLMKIFGNRVTLQHIATLVEAGCEIYVKKLYSQYQEMLTVFDNVTLFNVLTNLSVSVNIELYKIILPIYSQYINTATIYRLMTDIYSKDSCHKKERIEVITHLLLTYSSLLIKRISPNKVVYDCYEIIENILGKFGDPDDIIFFLSTFTPPYDPMSRIIMRAVKHENIPLIEYFSQSQLDIEWYIIIEFMATNSKLTDLIESVLLIRPDLNYTELLPLFDHTEHTHLAKICCNKGADGTYSNYLALRKCLESENYDLARYLIKEFPI